MRSLLINLLKSRVGFDINLFEIISVGECEDHTFYVYDDDTGEEWIFDTPEEAVDFFLILRDRKELGLDYEIGQVVSLV